MATHDLERPIMSFQEYVTWRAWKGLSDDEDAPPYAHPVDGWILRTLDSTPVKHVLDKAIDTLVSVELGSMVAHGVPIDPKSFPELFAMMSECARTLGIPTPHALTGSFGGTFNAFTAGTDEYSYVFITDALLRFYPPEEARFVIGHECGHIAAKHMVYHTLVQVLTGSVLSVLGPLGQVLRQFAAIPLLAWARRSEVTCDRAGLICCGDIDTAERALLRLATGFADAGKVDIDAYLKRQKEMREYHGSSSWREAFTTHPVIAKRLEALRLFARSELYYDLSGLPPPEGIELLRQAELDRLTNEIVKP